MAEQAGDKMKDGTIYAGVSPDTGKAMYVPPEDAYAVMFWESSMKYAADLDAHGHKDWRLPSKTELGVLFANHAKIGGFDKSGNRLYGSSENKPDSEYYGTWMQKFSNGDGGWYNKGAGNVVRPVRSEP